MSILEELWNGYLSPSDLQFRQDSTYADLLSYIIRHEKDLQDRRNDEEKEIFEKFTECSNEMYGIAEREAFARGFVLGTRIIIEVMNTEIE